MRQYSIIVPVYNRPDEIAELLASLKAQTLKTFEVLVIEDGSQVTCKHIVDAYQADLNISYYVKDNGGQGFARNYGFERAKGDYLIVFDSDCLIPKDYLAVVDKFLNEHPVDAFGGPDRAHASFNTLQKAISYSMTSPFTTGGIRGAKKHIGKFHPRSFNMGISKAVFESTGGYRITRMGEDLEFSIRIIDSGFETALIEEAFVYHKRRTSIGQFYKQLHFFGRARVNVNRFWPGEIKLIHLLPLFFVLGVFSLPLMTLFSPKLGTLAIAFLLFYYALIGVHALVRTKNVKVAIVSLATSFIQLYAYGMGIIAEKLRPRGNQPFAQK